MKYFNDLTKEQEQELFYIPPRKFDRYESKDQLAYALGATLYMPSTSIYSMEGLLNKKFKNIGSMVICLEDAIGDEQVQEGEETVLKYFQKINESIQASWMNQGEIPMIFLRIRNEEQMIHLANKLGENLSFLTGWVFPKFSYENGEKYLKSLRKINHIHNKALYAMPILESKDIIYHNTRAHSLENISKLLDDYKELVLNIRVGATDFSSLFGIRRKKDRTVYDLLVIRSCLEDILNCFTRKDREYVVSAPVWEYFSKDLTGLIRESRLDLVNGFIGKTAIHPSQLLAIQALHVVEYEDYLDACSIVENQTGKIGVMKSQSENKMNEMKPHLHWAYKILKKSNIYGVYHEQKNFYDLLKTNDRV